MATFGNLTPGSYFVIQEQENSLLELVYIPMITEKCVLVEFQDEDQTLTWYRKTDELFEVVEELTDEQAVIYESLFEGGDDDKDDDLFWGDDDDDELWSMEDDDEEEDDDILKN